MALLTTRRRTALVGFLAVQRLVELRRSSLNRRGYRAAVPSSPASYPAMVAAHIALFAVAAWPRRRYDIPAAVEAAAVAGLAGAICLRLSVIRELGPSWNVTAHVSPDTVVVTSGPFSRLRHPNYTAVALEFVCLPLAVGAPRAAIWLSLANALVLWPRVRAEEALLDRVPGYREAFDGVPRFVPRGGRRSQKPHSVSQSRGVNRAKPQ